MNNKVVNILIPALLLLTALAWVTFGSNLLNDSYGLKRDKLVHVPAVESTVSDITTLDDLKGHITYLTFGFSHCSGNCPFTLSQYIKLANLLPDDTRLVFVSIDNARDDMAHLKQYLAQIDPSIIGWIVNEDDLKPFAEQFDTYVSVSDNDEPQHGSGIQLIDKEGRWVKTYPYLNLNEEAVLADYQAIQGLPQHL